MNQQLASEESSARDVRSGTPGTSESETGTLLPSYRPLGRAERRLWTLGSKLGPVAL